MSRIIKNMVMIAIILGVCVLSFFIMKGAVKSNIANNSAFEKNFGGTMPQFKNGEFSEENRPQMPSGNFEKEDMPNKEELPEDFEKGEMPNIGELPEKFENGKTPEDFQGNFKNGNLPNRGFKQNISVIYYILFTLEGLTISLLVIYLIMSKFNSKTFKETLGTGMQKIVFIILVVIITVGLTLLQSMLAKNVFVSNTNMKRFKDRQNFRNNINNTNIINQDENNKI